jgi:hypothetical protein
MFTDEKKSKLAAILNQRLGHFGHIIKCPMCDNKEFIIADAYLRNDLQTDLTSVSIGGPSIPAIAIICKHCGFISQHAAGPLGLLPQEGATDGKN